MAGLVALQTMLPQIDSPLAVQTKALQLRALQREDQAAQLAAAAQQQALEDDRAVRQAYAANPNDSAARLAALAGVSPKAYATEAKQQSDLGKAQADTSKSQLEVATKRADLAGQAFGYVRNFPTPENAKSALAWLGQNGIYTPEQVAEYSAKVDAAPGNVKMMADQAFAAALSVKDQIMKVETRDTGGAVQTVGIDPVSGTATTLSTLAKTQSPDSIAGNNVRVSEGAKDRAAANMRNERTIAAAKEKAEAKGNAEASLDNATLDFLAEQALRGDRTVYTNLGRGAQGAANLVALRQKVSQKATERGITGADLASITADYSGQQAGLRTSGTISARIENAAAEAAELAPLALAASKEVARSGFLPFGRAQVMFNNNTNNPALNKFATANIGLATAYAGAMARGGKATVSDNEHARELLSTAKDQKAYDAIVNQMMLEIQAAQRAPQVVRGHLREQISGRGKSGGHSTVPNPVAAPALPSGWSVQEVK